MSAKAPQEIITIIDAIEMGFEDLWQRNDAVESYLNSLWDAGAELPDTLSSLEQIATFDALHDLTILRNKINRPLELRITPNSLKDKDRKRADKIEEHEANVLIRMGFVKGGWQYNALCWGLIAWSYVPMWAEIDDYTLPERWPGESQQDYNARADQYMRDWWGIHLTFDHPRTTAFLDDDRIVTAATRRYHIPVIDLERYMDGLDPQDPEMPAGEAYDARLKIVNETFDYLRAAQPEPIDALEQRNHGEWVEVREIHEGGTITHAIATNAKSRNGENNLFQEVGQYQNPLGRPGLFLATGNYTPGAPLHRRFQPGALPLIQAYKNRDRLRSYIASLMASAKKDHVIANPDVLKAWNALSPELRKEILGGTDNEDAFQLVPGEPIDITTVEHQWELSQILLRSIETDLQRMRPNATLSNNPDAAGAAIDATATAVVKAGEEEEIPLQGMQDEVVNVTSDILKAIQNMLVTSINSHYSPGANRSEEDKSLDAFFYSVTSGEEWVAGREVDPGHEIWLGPEDYSFSFTRKLQSLDLSLTTTRAKREEAFAQWYTPDGVHHISYDRFLELLGNRNVTKAKKEIWADTIFQQEVPRLFAQVGAVADRWVEVFLGMQRGTIGGQQPPQGQEQGSPGGAPGGGSSLVPSRLTNSIIPPASQHAQGDATQVSA